MPRLSFPVSLARSLACVCARGSAPSAACSPGHRNPFNLRRSTPRSATGADFAGQHRQRRELGQCVCARNQKDERFETHGDDVPFPPQTEKKEFENLILNASKTNFLFTARRTTIILLFVDGGARARNQAGFETAKRSS